MRTAVVVGHGMVGQRFCEELAARDDDGTWRIHVLGGERQRAYDRIGLSRLFGGEDPAVLDLVPAGFFDDPHRMLSLGDAVSTVDTVARTVTTVAGRTVAYDALVLATGSVPFVPPIPGHDLPGCVAYRSIDDVEAIRALAAGARTGIVIGGGLLGLEAANGLRLLGLETHIVELAPRLMPVQLDDGGAAALRRRIEDLGLTVHLGAASDAVVAGPDGRVAGLRLADGTVLDADLVVFSAGIRPADALGAAAGLDRHERGGILVDEACRTSAPDVYAVGECAVAGGRVWGLVAPGYRMAAVAADQIIGGAETFQGADLSTKLKLLGVEVASVGTAPGLPDGVHSIVLDDPTTSTYKRVDVDALGRVVGAVLVGDASAFTTLAAMARGDLASPPDAASLVAAAGAPPLGGGGLAMADGAQVCSCNGIDAGTIRHAVKEGALDAAAVKACTRAGSTCGGCVPLVNDLIVAQHKADGVAVRRVLCEHFDLTRQELFDLVLFEGHRSFESVLSGHGTGRGCEVCRPAVASILASLGGGYVLADEQAALQDTNDHFLANLQKDGTYSVVPRIPGGEVTPEGLIAIGEVARDFGLYTKITGGQRIDLFGATVDQLPAIWERLIAAGFESGHAYGKALRTVKSCVGSTWCRYGVQDSVAMAIALELRYRGLRAPHKIKLAVSGCARECAEAQSKDVGVIATETGWNLYVGGNGGQRPRHAQLLATDLDDEELVRTIDRYLAYYVRTADRLERTATWMEKLEGGIDHVRRVVLDDALGIGAELDALIERHVATYRCEWAETLADAERRARFTSFVNHDGSDPNVVFISERGQRRPARAEEKPPAAEVDAGAALVEAV